MPILQLLCAMAPPIGKYQAAYMNNQIPQSKFASLNISYELSQCIIAKLNPTSKKLMLCYISRQLLIIGYGFVECGYEVNSGILAYDTFHGQP